MALINKGLLILFLLSMITPRGFGQQVDLPEDELTRMEVEAQLRFLASDALAGRYTGSEGNNVAAAFIAKHLQAYGYAAPEGAEGYRQEISFEAVRPPQESKLEFHKTAYTHLDDYLILAGAPLDVKTEAIFAGHGWVEEGHDDYAGLDVKGKVVFVLPGTPESQDPNTVFQAMRVKRDLAEERGAVAVFELYRLSFPWAFFKQYFGKESMRLADEERAGKTVTYGWVTDISSTDAWTRMQSGKKTKVSLKSSGYQRRNLPSQNVIGVLEGTDPELKEEYLLLTAHYDHVGVGEQGGQYTPEDSIFNGARDNAMGTVALLAGAKSLAELKPKRSVIVLAVTGEELGLLGSRHYADNPLIPLEDIIYNLNTDGGGYNTTEHVSVFGFGRTGTDAHLKAAAERYGLGIIPDPAPEQNLYDRSDNVSFAAKGVPALTLSPGMDEFDAEIGRYYHRPDDEADAVDMDYLLKYCQAYAHAARLIANDAARPFWIEGDKYEEAGKELYNR